MELGRTDTIADDELRDIWDELGRTAVEELAMIGELDDILEEWITAEELDIDLTTADENGVPLDIATTEGVTVGRDVGTELGFGVEVGVEVEVEVKVVQLSVVIGI